MKPAKSVSSCSPGTLVTTNNPQCETCAKLMKQRDEAQRRYDELVAERGRESSFCTADGVLRTHADNPIQGPVFPVL